MISILFILDFAYITLISVETEWMQEVKTNTTTFYTAVQNVLYLKEAKRRTCKSSKRIIQVYSLVKIAVGVCNDP